MFCFVKFGNNASCSFFDVLKSSKTLKKTELGKFIPNFTKHVTTSTNIFDAVTDGYYRNSLPKVFCKKGVRKKFANSQENACVGVSFIIKLQASDMV